MYKIDHKSLNETKYFFTIKEAIKYAEALGLKRYSVKHICEEVKK